MNYIKDPLYVSVVNPREKNNLRLYYFLGNIPNDVLNAAQSGIYNEKNQIMEWSKNNSKILKDFYGNEWKQKLTGEEPSMELYAGFDIYKYIRNASVTLGGNEDSNLSEIDTNIFGDLTVFDTSMTPVIKTDDTQVSPEILHYTSDNKNIYSNVSIYSEDNLYDLRLKIYLLTKIPIFRQFIFYFLDNQGPYYTYQISINKIPYNIKWQNILEPHDLNINGIGIDIFFEQNRHAIEIISYDKVILMETKSKHKINKVYVIDLFDILQDRSITDKYQFNLLYYGFIIKYWPQLTPDAFRLVLSDISKIESIYPILNANFDELYQKQVIEQNIINRTYKNVEINDYSMAITNSNIIIIPKLIRVIVNIRNIFDQLILNNKISAMFINFKHGIRQQYYISKKHSSILNQELVINYPKNTLAIYIEGPQQIILTIAKNGKYEISVKWLEDDQISFNNITGILSKNINPIINQINELGASVFPTGGQLNLLSDDIIFNMLTLSLYYPFVFSLQEFNGLKLEFKSYELINIIKVHGLQVSRIFSFIFYKGIIDTSYLYDGYKWIYENIDNVGRRIRIIHRSDRLQIELNNIKSLEEFMIIKRYIFSLIDNYIKSHNLKKNKKIDVTNVKSIRKLHDLDPDLYNLSKYDKNATSYSVLCQSGRQPTIYDEDNIDILSKDKKQKLVKYWNFTHKKPAYYLCGTKYPYINFITDKHSKGYCLPCCKKLKDTPGTTVAKINEECLKNKVYKTESVEYAYVLAYGKKLVPGRRSYVPDIITNILPKAYIHGVKQNYNSDTNVGFIYSLKHILGENCILELANLAKEMNQFYILGNGQASIFRSSEELYSELLSNFVINTNLLLTNIDMSLWSHILTDLVRYKYNIEIITLNNDASKIILNAYQDSVITIGKNNMNVIMLFKDDENGINPIVDDTDNYIFEGIKFKQLFSLTDDFVMDLIFIISFAKKNNKSISTIFINLKNQCYGVMIDSIYIPILSSPKPYNLDIPISYELRPEPTNTKTQLLKIIDEINNYRNNSIIIKTVISNGKNIIGFESFDNLIYFHIPEIDTFDEFDKIVVPYDFRAIDEAILKRITVNELTNLGLQKNLQNNMYNLFVSEFTSIIQMDINVDIRNDLKKIINSINFLNSKSINNMTVLLSELLIDYPMDIVILNDFIEFAYFHMIDIKNILNFIDSSKFEFDYKLLRKLKNMNDKKTIVNELKKIMEPYLYIGNINDIPQEYNIFTSCIDNKNQFFCNDGKLIVSKDKINDFYDVLSDDILNKSKTYLLMSSVSGLFDYLKFTKRPHEFIDIYEIKDV